jgi:hypothetical protein
MTRRDALPLESVRDLLGIVRAMYAAAKCDGAPEERLNELVQIGKQLRQAMDLARRTDPDTNGHRAAWTRAEDACKRLGALVTLQESAAPVVAAAASRLRGRH